MFASTKERGLEPHETSLLDEARHCDDCLCWLEHCRAACCRQFAFRLRPDSWVDRTGREVRIHVALDDDRRRYYELHGVRVEADAVVVPESNCDFTADRLVVSMTCAALQQDCRCSLHPDGKPEICTAYTAQTAGSTDYPLLPECLFSYKPRVADLDQR